MPKTRWSATARLVEGKHVVSKEGVRYGGEPFSQCNMSFTLFSSAVVVVVIVLGWGSA